MAHSNELIETFIERYKREYNFYYDLARLACEQCERIVSENRIKAIVTSRAKSAMRLKEKLYQRHKEKKYQTEEDIRKDIVDLSGVRIALYFPADRRRIASLLEEAFEIEKVNFFPKGEKKQGYRFDGYHAEHYRIKLQPDQLKEEQERYANQIIEIQIASVLMHAWSEVNHDLAYKPLNGMISQQELSILDGLNGLVLTGEILLEQLQEAFQKRVTDQKEPFVDQYELATFVSERLKKSHEDTSFIMGEEFDLLSSVLYELSQDTPVYVDELLQNIDKDIYSTSVSRQLLTVIFEKNINHYDIFYNLILDNEYETKIFNYDETKERLKIILAKLIVFRRYMRYLVSLNDIKHPSLFIQLCLVGEIFNVSFSFLGLFGLQFIVDIYHCIYKDLGRHECDLSEIDKEITLMLNCLEQIDAPDSQKAMEWARSGQLELPVKNS